MLPTTNSGRLDNHLPLLGCPLYSSQFLGNVFIWSYSLYSFLVPLVIYDLYFIIYMTFLVVVSMNAGCHLLYAIQNQKFHMLCFDKRFKCLSVSDEWYILKFDKRKMINFCMNTFSLYLLHMFVEFFYDQRNKGPLINHGFCDRNNSWSKPVKEGRSIICVLELPVDIWMAL